MNIINIKIDQAPVPKIQPELESIQGFVSQDTLWHKVIIYMCFSLR